MFLRALSLHNFRSYEEALFEFDPHITVIQGNNAVGKTTLLEAIHLLMTGSTFRQAQMPDMIRYDQPAFRIEAHFVKHGVNQKLAIYCEGSERRIFYNSSPCASVSHLLGLIPGVTTHPDDVALVKGAPAGRRQYLDLQLAQANPLYVHHLNRYYKAMRQRNALLKSKQTATIETWEHEMAQSAAFLVLQRARVVKRLEMSARQMYQKLSQEPLDLHLVYRTGAPETGELRDLQAYYQETFTRYRKREMEFGATLNGPHKDDLMILIGSQEARYFASEGQQRSCVMAMKLAEWEHLKAVCEVVPLMLIDDVGMSLDAARRQRLFEHLTDLKQVFLTGTGDIKIPDFIKQSSIMTINR